MKKNFISSLFFDHIFPNLVLVALVNIPAAVICIFYVLAFFTQTIRETASVPNLPDLGTISINFNLAIVCFVICILSLLLCGSYAIVCVINKNRKPAFPILRTSYRLTDCLIEMYFKDRGHIIVRHRNSFIVQKSGLTYIKHTMNWTGTKYVKSNLTETCYNKGFRLADSNRDRSPHTVIVNLPEEAQINHTDKYALDVELEDGNLNQDNRYENCIMIPMLGKMIKQQTDKLTLRLTVPQGLVSNVTCCISADIPKELLLSNDNVPIIPKETGDYLVYEYIPKDVDLLRNYVLQWNFIE